MIPFNKPPFASSEEKYVLEAMKSSKLSGDGHFSAQCHEWFENQLGCKKAMLTPSCTHSLEMAAMLIDIQPGDEVIMPSFTFVSTANAFALRGARIIFVDIRPDTMNIDEKLIEKAVTSKTKAIVPVHYAGVSCEMDPIMEIASRYGLYVIEDAAQGMMSSYRGRPLGTMGHLGAISFHETKNFSSGGEGGLLIINDPKFVRRAEIIREKGTNRNQFFRGMVDKYTWVDMGSSYLMSELQAAYLWGQLQKAETIQTARMDRWNQYFLELSSPAFHNILQLPSIPDHCTHNAHIFHVKTVDLATRTALINHLKNHNIVAVFHYVPLHSSPMGQKIGHLSGQDTFTTTESERLLRLPMFNLLRSDEVSRIITAIKGFYQ
ncbi:MAG: dTDP-4-amino-4,6-dideoxygalactose transaminase [Candidatus Wallbacteria bacterium HGW-Wallbacteria-1]|jgi:dTDP-4-amino-4,6-dideoxygalactose transaminase|uniref:dTDP-4-amino-4,6-dideoxygalactose transaminase n=1 Tax=Candidatus Wallbacteria bacterium HGW-Wallbacteria-1 TaxID=2013854 RepID=A0A2N1PMC0_9BACT|nr:MAG: dTDP-4-amino-4,6-dideoxygalactose transaminase [Candidatus Wallbacteria bacterium HGW-Wallbacteria-1]